MSEKKTKFEIACKEFLDKQILGELRAYGRHLGVDNPTKLKKDLLIDAIIDVRLGRVAPVPRPTRGAPIRADYFNPRIAETVEEYYEKYANPPMVVETFQERLAKMERNVLRVRSPEAEEIEAATVYAQVEKANGRYRLLPCDIKWRDFSLFLHQHTVDGFKLLDGDTVACTVKQEFPSCDFYANSILSVNGNEPFSVRRFQFEEGDVYFPEKQICLGGEGALNKFIDGFAPLGAGQRYLLSAPTKTGKSQALKALAEALSNQKEYQLLVLLNESAPEVAAGFRRFLSSEQLVATAYGDDPAQIIRAANNALKRAKRYAETGKDVVLLVDGLVELTLAYNEIVPSGQGRTPIAALEGEAVRYGKRFLSTARNFFADGSLTIVASVKCGGTNPAVDFLADEFLDMANGRLIFSEALAQKRIFPAIDCAASYSEQSEEFLGKDGAAFEKRARKTFSSLGNERVLQLLEETNTLQEFLQKASSFC